MKICFHSFDHPRYSGFVDTVLLINGARVDRAWCEARGFAVSHERVSIGGDLYADIPAQILRKYKSVEWARSAHPGGHRGWRGSGASAIKKLTGVFDATLPSAWTQTFSPWAAKCDPLACKCLGDRLMAFRGPKLNMMLAMWFSVMRKQSKALQAVDAARGRLRPYYTNAQLCALSNAETLRLDAAHEALARRRFARHNVIL